jgi:hypothetical protein
METPAPGPAACEGAPLQVRLAERQRLDVVAAPGTGELRLFGTDGSLRLRLELTPGGTVLHVAGKDLKIDVRGDLALAADRLALVGRRELALHTEGTLSIAAEGDLHSTARAQHIAARLGNVDVKANDDVRLNGERVMVNC